MDRLSTDKLILELIEQPTFCVRDGSIIYANEAARQIQIQAGSCIMDYLTEESKAFYTSNSACSSLTMHFAGHDCIVTVTHTDDYDIFTMRQSPTAPELKMFNLAAQQMRAPLTSALTICDDILNESEDQLNEKIAHISRALYQLHRIVCNIADTGRYWESGGENLAPVNLTAFFDEIMQKVTATMMCTGIQIVYHGPKDDIITMAQLEKLTRAVYNIISNAIKYSPAQSTINVRLSRHDTMVHFSVQDAGDGIPSDIIPNIYTRYLRQPGIEDGRNGIGLGMPLIQAAASAHSGTVLIDRQEGQGTKITLTLQIKPVADDTLRSPVLTFCDYAGGRDIALLELSDVLPASAYLENS